LPKASRGHRPAPNPKKRAQRMMGPRTFSSAPSAVLDAPEAEFETERPAVRSLRPAPAMARPATRRPMTTAVVRKRFIESAADYAYVSKDLVTIGVLAASLLAVLIVLSFVIR